jgi:hypothetical protein
MTRTLISALAIALLLTGIPSAGIAALCQSERGVQHSCCCRQHAAFEANQACCCDIGDQKEERTSSFVPQPRHQESAPALAALPSANAEHPLRPNDALLPASSTWQPPPGAAPIYLTVLQLLI